MMLDLHEFLAENLGYAALQHDDFVLEMQEKIRRDHVKRALRDREFTPYLRKQKLECDARKPAKKRPMTHRAYFTRGSKGKWTRFNGEWVKL